MAEETAHKPDRSVMPRPMSWIQYLIVYPTLALALFGSVPTVWHEFKAWQLGVASSKLQLVQEQQRLWERNLDCITQQGVYEADGVEGLLVKVTLCASGDVLLRYYQEDWAPQFKWVARPVLKEP